MKKALLFAAAISLLTYGCNTKQSDQNLSHEHLVYSTLWIQHSPEAKALYHQGFNIAKRQLTELIKTDSDKPKAVIVDLDETMIDNSPFQGQMITKGKPYSPDFWAEWSMLSKASATPGAKDFTYFCDSIGVEVIYLSNRRTTELEWTMKNLDSLGFAFVNADNFFLMDETSDKEPRRQKVGEDYEIVMLLGDNLNDFAEVFQNRGDDWGLELVEKYKHEFGKRFIVFPNPMYGEWEKNVYDHKKGLSDAERFRLRRAKIKAF